jgi:hypothetical protein
MKRIMTLLVAVALILAISGAAQALRPSVLTFTLAESGGNVVGTVSGSVNTSALIRSAAFNTGYMRPFTAFLSIGGTSAQSVNAWLGIVGPASFGSGDGVPPNSGSSASLIGMGGSSGKVYLPIGYISGTALSGTAIWNSTTLSGLGIATGTYTWTYNGGVDSVVLNAGASAVPEPGTILAALSILGPAGMIFRRRKA